MPGDHGYDNEEKERKQRIKKMKAKTSKMRLAGFTPKFNNQTGMFGTNSTTLDKNGMPAQAPLNKDIKKKKAFKSQ